jgi:hypothetical protein
MGTFLDPRLGPSFRIHPCLTPQHNSKSSVRPSLSSLDQITPWAGNGRLFISARTLASSADYLEPVNNCKIDDFLIICRSDAPSMDAL